MIGSAQHPAVIKEPPEGIRLPFSDDLMFLIRSIDLDEYMLFKYTGAILKKVKTTTDASPLVVLIQNGVYFQVLYLSRAMMFIVI